MKQRIGYLLVQKLSKSVSMCYTGWFRTSDSELISRALSFISLGGTLQSSIHLIQLHTSTMGPKRRLPAKQTSLTEAELSQVPATRVLDSVKEVCFAGSLRFG